MASVFHPFRIIGLTVVGLTLTGCVSQDQYNALKLKHDRLAENFMTAQSEAKQATAAAAMLKQQLEQTAGTGGATQAIMTNLQAKIDSLTQERDDLTRRYNDALAHAGSTPLSPQLTSELNAFAQQNPELVDFDSARGIVKFKSDVTFSTGDATVQAKAKEVIDRFAKILVSTGAAGYELQVAGHTDNVPVSSQATKAAGHKDNWYLSVHRAIAVSNELQHNGVSATRIAVVGYADQRPATSNASAAGQAQNRRVEVLILPTSARTGAPQVAAARQGPAKVRVDKDSTPVRQPLVPPQNK